LSAIVIQPKWGDKTWRRNRHRGADKPRPVWADGLSPYVARPVFDRGLWLKPC
jgi:hypothetical protein